MQAAEPGSSGCQDARSAKRSMTRLSTYLVGRFSAEAAALFGIAAVIMFLVQCLRFVDSGAVRGQGLGILLVQALLAMPGMVVSFLFVCVAIGLARSLRGLQATRELHIIHGGQRLGTLLGAIGMFAFAGALLALLLTHIVAPTTSRAGTLIRAKIAADLVGRSLVPNRFAEVAEGVTITVGGRQRDGSITSFFADDQRSADARRTYIAESALLTADELGYVIQLKNGTIQFRTADGQFSEISFSRYDMALERFTGDSDRGVRRGDNSSISLVSQAIESGEWSPETLGDLIRRSVEGLRVLALCAFVAAVTAFPSGRRREPILPIELVVLGVGFAERGISNFLPVEGLMAPATGSIVLLCLSLIVLIFRLRVFAPQPREVHSQ